MMSQSLFRYYNHLGFISPYYLMQANKILVRETITEAVSELKGPRVVDTTAILQILNKNFIFGNRTLIKGISKTPWMAKPNDAESDWQFYSVPEHEERRMNEAAIADNLFSLLKLELLEYLRGKRTIGVLLSGGMDSRVVAGVLDSLIKEGSLQNVSVTALTWGNEDSRDVVYAQEIARRLNWDWRHYLVKAEDVKQNIEETAISGAEFSPVHLHAMPNISKENILDVVLAGSFGDSVGRAEYSGVKVTNLRSLADGVTNVGGLLLNSTYRHGIKDYRDDIIAYQRLFPKKSRYQQYEQDYQLHYMRRMLNPCMAVINRRMPLLQVFTSPSVFGFIWKIHPEKRNDLVYKYLINNFVTSVSDIRWARTGLPYCQTTGVPDNFNKHHHSYNQIIRAELLHHIEDLVLSKRLQRLRIFNTDSIKQLLRLVRIFPHDNIWYEEKLLWIAAFSRMVDIYGLEMDCSVKKQMKDYLLSGVYCPGEFILRNCKQML